MSAYQGAADQHTRNNTTGYVGCLDLLDIQTS